MNYQGHFYTCSSINRAFSVTIFNLLLVDGGHYMW